MKKTAKVLTIILSIVSATIFLFGCGVADGSLKGGDYYEHAPDAISKAGTPEGGTEDNDQQYTSGTMTAGAHDDNLYYDLYKELFYRGQTVEENGKFARFSGENNYLLDSSGRIKVTVKNENEPVCNAPVVFTGTNGFKYYAQTDSNGACYVFGNTNGGKITAVCGDYENTIDVTSDDDNAEVLLSGNREKGKVVEIMLVVDVTGSMGDELNYLKAELSDVVNKISNDLKGVTVRLAMLFYRDNGDTEKLSFSDFSDVTIKANLEKQQKKINRQRADGGGDYEEAVDEALELAVSKQWSENSTKIIFHFLDAPIHKGTVYEKRFSDAVTVASKKGIRICPVLASGADIVTEYIERQAAILTGGTFAFITDHSGVGGTHYDPEIPNVVIEKLNALLIRLVKGYYTGTFEKPVSYDGKEYRFIDCTEVESGFIRYGAKSGYAKDDDVVIVTRFIDGKVKLLIDGEFCCYGEKFVDDDYGFDESLKFTFKMPDKDVKITFETEVLSDVID